MSTAKLRETPLAATHRAEGARLVDFAGWLMPVQYQGILREHQAVRQRCGLFDVSHMGRLTLIGPGAAAFLAHVLSFDASELPVGQARYGLLCQSNGGILDDLFVYRLGRDRYLVVVNAANTASDLDWLHSFIPEFNVQLSDETDGRGMLAVQGPQAVERLQTLTALDLGGVDRRHWAEAQVAGRNCLLLRTGYTGEDGFELIPAAEDLVALWTALREAGAEPCGLGARDTLRLEAALPLHGQDIRPTDNPYEAGLGWAVELDRDAFVGDEALRRVKAEGPRRRLAHFIVRGRGIARPGYPLLHDGQPVGRVTSGGPAPTLGVNIGMGYLPTGLARPGTPLAVEIRGEQVPVEVVPRPFYRRQKAEQVA